ncbi:MAG: hypothetical protein RB292_03720 [Patescibacteria group bacterium]|jgi:hypothetical protein|nr:hypothetical protein [Patescibacteria group bacterium]
MSEKMSSQEITRILHEALIGSRLVIRAEEGHSILRSPGGTLIVKNTNGDGELVSLTVENTTHTAITWNGLKKQWFYRGQVVGSVEVL